MKYIPGHQFKVNKRIIQGKVKKFFFTGKTYVIFSINRKNNEYVYVFSDGINKFEFNFPDAVTAEGMIEYLVAV